MEETQEQVVKLIDEANLATSAADIVKLLEQIQELTVEKQPELLDNFFDEILEFQIKPFPSVRQHVIEFVEVACKKDTGLLLKSIPTLNRLLHDESSAVKKRVVLANTNLYQAVVKEVCSTRPRVQDPRALWDDVQAIKELIRSMISDSNTGVRTSVLKFLELHVLAMSLRTSESESRKADAGLEIIPLRHSFLDVAILREDGRTSFKLLLAQLEDEKATSINIQAMITLLCSIARARPTFMEGVLTRMLKLHESPPAHLPEGQIKSVQRKLKGALVTLLKHSSSAEFHEELIPILEKLEVPYTTINEHDMRGQIRDRVNGSEKSAKAEVGLGTSNKSKGPIDPLIEFDRIKNGLPLPLLVELLLTSLKNLPDTLRKRVLPSTNAATTAPRQIIIESNPIQRKREGDTELVSERKHKKPYRLVASKFDEDDRSKAIVSAFKRILSADGKMTEGGAKRNRVLLISRMASVSDDPAMTDELIKFIVDSPKERKELALVWLYHQHQRIIINGADKEKKESSVARYDRCIERFLVILKEKLESKDQLVSWILLQLPRFTKGALEVVRSYCEDPSSNAMGFLSLRELIKDRPPVRGMCLPVLLAYTRSTDIIIRTRAIRVCKKLIEIQSLKQPIEDFAISGLLNLKDAEESADGEESKWSTDIIQTHLYLFFDLILVKPDLLTTLISTYPKMKLPDIKRVVRLTARDEMFRKEKKEQTIKSIDWASTLVDHPPGSEDLVLHLLHCVTDSYPGKPPQPLIAAVRKIYDRNQDDPRFLIPIVHGLSKAEVISALPALLALKDNVVTQLIDRILGIRQGTTANIGTSSLNSSELLVALHGPRITTKNAIRGLNKCFERKNVFTYEVLAVALQQLVDQNPLPVLFMRTAILALNMTPKMKEFIVTLLHRLVSKKIWKDPTLWKGFVKACAKTSPQSLEILLQLPIVERQSAFDIEPALRDRLIVHIKKLTTQQRATLDSSIFEQLHVNQETGKPEML